MSAGQLQLRLLSKKERTYSSAELACPHNAHFQERCGKLQPLGRGARKTALTRVRPGDGSWLVYRRFMPRGSILQSCLTGESNAHSSRYSSNHGRAHSYAFSRIGGPDDAEFGRLGRSAGPRRSRHRKSHSRGSEHSGWLWACKHSPSNQLGSLFDVKIDCTCTSCAR